MFYINKLVIIGVGMIGGSIALALKRENCVKEIVGLGRNPRNLNLALKNGVIDKISDSYRCAIDKAEVIIIATPISMNEPIMLKIKPFLNRNAILIDVGSTKSDFFLSAKKILANNLANVVPCHPIAGAEKSGVSAANINLFVNKKVIITPLKINAKKNINFIIEMWKKCGASVIQMSIKKHDKLFSGVSHFPHVLAFLLVAMIGARKDKKELLSHAASGFKDFTRIASSSPEMWADICISNDKNLVNDMKQFSKKFNIFLDLIQNHNKTEIKKIFLKSQNIRDKWLDEKK